MEHLKYNTLTTIEKYNKLIFHLPPPFFLDFYNSFIYNAHTIITIA